MANKMEGYYRYPAIHEKRVVFCCRGELWLVGLAGGEAIPLTDNFSNVSFPVFSPDGTHIAFVSTKDGDGDVYILNCKTKSVERITFFGEKAKTIGWNKKEIFFSSSFKQAHWKSHKVFFVNPQTKALKEHSIGPVSYISYGDQGQSVLQRFEYREFSWWKRYRGGAAGDIWIDTKGNCEFEKLITMQANLHRPLWIRDRIYFSSDKNGVGNLFSCDLKGEDIKQHTNHEYYVRNQTTDKTHILYHSGGCLYEFNTFTQKTRKILATVNSPSQRREKSSAWIKKHLEHSVINANGKKIAIINRGNSFLFDSYEGPGVEIKKKGAHRHRLACWLQNGDLVIVNTVRGIDQLEVYDVDSRKKKISLYDPLIGRVVSLKPSPVSNQIVLQNHRNQLVHVNLDSRKTYVIDQNGFEVIPGYNWSPDGEWIAYSISLSHLVSVIKLFNVTTRFSAQVTEPVIRDMYPSFDPEGKYLFFTSIRQLEPIADKVGFGFSFPKASRLYLIHLQKEPFSSTETKKLRIDFEEIEKRITALPVQEGVYSQIFTLKDKVLFESFPVQGMSNRECLARASGASNLELFDLRSNKVKTVAKNSTDFQVSTDLKTLIFRKKGGVNILSLSDKEKEASFFMKEKRKLNWSGMKLCFNEADEFQQVFDEAWHLQSEFFWKEKITNVDWNKVYEHYNPLLQKVRTMDELHDLIWEMQGELEVSHAFIFEKSSSKKNIGFLGADFSFSEKKKGYRIDKIFRGDSWNEEQTSPLASTGLNIKEGDILWAVNGIPVSETRPPELFLSHSACKDVTLAVSSSNETEKREVSVKPLQEQRSLYHKNWVREKREYTHFRSQGKIGYIHLPDTLTKGIAEFQTGFLREQTRKGLIIDLRYNNGGDGSPFILDRLLRPCLGEAASRWFGHIAYPRESFSGPLVFLINQFTASDGELLAQAFKKLKAATLVGTRTWGGFTAMWWGRNFLVDGSVVTQPEFSFSFGDSFHPTENYGVTPDIEVDIFPSDYIKGQDPQIDQSIEKLLSLVEEKEE